MNFKPLESKWRDSLEGSGFDSRPFARILAGLGKPAFIRVGWVFHAEHD
jgi:hypothetical protein